MSVQVPLEKEYDLIKTRLGENLARKRALELQINADYERLKRIEGSIERNEANREKRA